MIHLAVLREPFYTKIILGKKTVESRFTLNRITPYQRIVVNDIIYFKLVADEKIRYYTDVKKVLFAYGYDNCKNLLIEYKNEICIDDEYINSKSESYYLTLIWLGIIKSVGDIPLISYKKDRRTWIRGMEIREHSIVDKI